MNFLPSLSIYSFKKRQNRISYLLLTGFLMISNFLYPAEFTVSAGNVYDSGGLIEAILAANENNDPVNIIRLAQGSTYIVNQVYGDADDRDANYGPVGLPPFTQDKRIIIEGNGSTIRKEGGGNFRLMFLFMNGELVLNDLTMENGSITDIGGAALMINFSSELEINRCTFQGNATSNGSGGALRLNVRTQAVIRNSTFQDNSAFGDGGAIYVITSDLRVENSRFLSNQVVNSEPSGSSDETGGGAIFVDGADFSENRGEVSILNSLFENNQATSTQGRFTQGGALFLFAYNNNVFVVDGCTIRNNRSDTFGGGMSLNGGSLNNGTYNASFSVINCTLDNNHSGGQGGGIWASGTTRNRGNPRILIENVTFHQNEADEFGAGLVNLFQGLSLSSCTFAFNRSQRTGGAIFNGTNSGGTMSINNSIFYANESIENPPSNHCSTNLSGGNNLQFPIVNNERFCAPGNVSLDPLLGPLQDNGGPVPTMALQMGSPAVDAGNRACVRSDARGLFRNGACDLGAYELNGLDVDPNPLGEELQVFNMISPNGDGQNDFWQINNLESLESYFIQVINKNGQVVFETSQYNQNWDGTFNGQPLPPGIYFYTIQIGNSNKPDSGYITLIR